MMDSLKQQIEKRKAKLLQGNRYDLARADELSQFEKLLANYEKEEENIRGALAETTTKLIAKIEYLEREILNMREVEKESVCIPIKQFEEWLLEMHVANNQLHTDSDNFHSTMWKYLQKIELLEESKCK